MPANPCPKVALVGRTNVGKSTLFNRLIEEKKALVSNIAGTTRDRNQGQCIWNGQEFTLIDTGGLDVSYLGHERQPKNILRITKDITEMEKNIIKQTQAGIKEADLVILVLDGQVGVLPSDRTVLHLLYKNKKKFIIAVNKIDSSSAERKNKDFDTLGESLFFISARNGRGSGELLDEISIILAPKLPKVTNKQTDLSAEVPPTAERRLIKVALVGKPNVGKSSLFNAIFKEEKVIVSSIPHTTRETHDEIFEYQGERILFLDTAGVAKHILRHGQLEQLGIERTESSIKKSDIVLLVLDATETIGLLEKRLIESAVSSRTGLVIVVNKWDLVPDKKTNTPNELVSRVYNAFPFATWAPVIYLSAKTGAKIDQIFDLILEIWHNKNIEISNSSLDHFLNKIIKKHRPSRGKGVRHPYIYTLEQTRTNPPHFLLTIGNQADLHFSYVRFIENQMRQQFSLRGTPIHIELKKR